MVHDKRAIDSLYHTSWPQLISYFLVAPACLHVASDWPHTFYTQGVFACSINIEIYLSTIYFKSL